MMKLYSKGWLVGLSLVWATLVIQAMLATPPVRAAGPWYVGLGGSDGATCLSPATRCASINGALAKAGFVAGDTIYVAVGTYTGTGGEVVLLDKDATLSGGWDGTFTSQNGMSTIDGENSRRGMTVNSGVTAIIERFTIRNGFSDVCGCGGILNNGTLTINNSTVNNNFYGVKNDDAMTLNNSVINGNSGVGIFNGGTMNLNNSTVSGNVGRGILNGAGTLVLDNSAVIGNSASGDCSSGGGIYTSGALTLNNSTVSGNIAGNIAGDDNDLCHGQGGGIFNDNYFTPVTLNSSTVSNNWTSGTGGGISGTATLQNSIIAGNMARASYSTSDCAGSVGSTGYNLIGNPPGCGFAPTTGDLTNVDAKLGPLEGSPGYHPLLFGSPAINAGNPAGCMGSTGLLTTDQRGMPRVGRCDIGAYEYDGVIIQTFLPLIFLNY